jgi:hypothetical protein
MDYSRRSNSCNIYEAGMVVKHSLKHTSPVTAQVRIIAPKYFVPLHMRSHLQQFDEPCTVAAGFYPNDHFVCEAGVEATDIIPFVL